MGVDLFGFLEVRVVSKWGWFLWGCFEFINRKDSVEEEGEEEVEDEEGEVNYYFYYVGYYFFCWEMGCFRGLEI